MLKPIQRFVLLLHVISDNRHWDLMLENGDHLATWRLPLHPSQMSLTGTTDTLPAERIADHRLAYLTYEGQVSGARGEVKREDQGHYELLSRSPDIWQVRLAGDTLNGVFELSAGVGKGQIRIVQPVTGSDRGPAPPA